MESSRCPAASGGGSCQAWGLGSWVGSSCTPAPQGTCCPNCGQQEKCLDRPCPNPQKPLKPQMKLSLQSLIGSLSSLPALANGRIHPRLFSCSFPHLNPPPLLLSPGIHKIWSKSNNGGLSVKSVKIAMKGSYLVVKLIPDNSSRL